MCVSDETLSIDTGDAPLVVEVTSGFATKGKFRASVRHPDGRWEEFASGDIADSTDDVFIVPVDAADLPACRLLIVGNYSPAHIPSGTQISVDYVFRQSASEKHRSKIREDRAGVVSCNHSYRFRD